MGVDTWSAGTGGYDLPVRSLYIASATSPRGQVDFTHKPAVETADLGAV
jgi:hypothetical protein